MHGEDALSRRGDNDGACLDSLVSVWISIGLPRPGLILHCLHRHPHQSQMTTGLTLMAAECHDDFILLWMPAACLVFCVFTNIREKMQWEG